MIAINNRHTYHNLIHSSVQCTLNLNRSMPYQPIRQGKKGPQILLGLILRFLHSVVPYKMARQSDASDEGVPVRAMT